MTSPDPTGSRAMRDIFGHLPDGTPVERVTLRGVHGFEVAIMTFGAAVQALHAPYLAEWRFSTASPTLSVLSRRSGPIRRTGPTPLQRG
jgi:hypothetical protein